jgi:hypothetical protein
MLVGSMGAKKIPLVANELIYNKSTITELIDILIMNLVSWGVFNFHYT